MTKPECFFHFATARKLNDGIRRAIFASHCGEPIWRTKKGLWIGGKPTPDAELLTDGTTPDCWGSIYDLHVKPYLNPYLKPYLNN